jgi:hypothetical protein
VRFGYVSKSHGTRIGPEQALAALKQAGRGADGKNIPRRAENIRRIPLE